MKTAFIGLGVMGFPMAGHLKAAGHAVAVYNRHDFPDFRPWSAQHTHSNNRPQLARSLARPLGRSSDA